MEVLMGGSVAQPWAALAGFAVLLAVVSGVAWLRLRAKYRVIVRAVDCMYQGVVVYDASERLIHRNSAYVELYGLSDDYVKPGIRLIDVLRHRIAKFNLEDNADAYRARLMAKISRGEATRAIGDSGTGRLIAVNNRPTGDGGWVGTHEDVTEQLQVQKQRDLMAEQEARRTKIETAVSTFRSRIDALLGGVGDNAGSMRTTAAALLESSNKTTERAERAAGESGKSSENIRTAAGAAEELLASIGEISRQLDRVSSDVRDAASSSRSTNDEISALGNAAQKIGDVVGLIRDVAGQTNLLALNATIEAARAGEAGRGFAVVASEVKSLAIQTGKATEEITGQILAVQTSARDAVEAIRSIAERMTEINGSTSSAAAAVEQQNAATAQILESVTQAASTAQLVASALRELTNAAAETRASARSVLEGSQSVEDAITNLRAEVAGFLGKVAS